MKRIAYLMGSYPMWSETFIEQELRLLIESALPILPIAIRRGNRELPSDLMNPIYLDADSPFGDPADVAPPKSHGALPPFFRRIFAVKKNRELMDSLVTVMNKFKAGHIHAAMGDQPGLIAAATAREMGIPYSLSLHAHDVFFPKYDDGYLYDKAELIICCNKAASDALLKRRPKIQKKLYVVHHGLQLPEWPQVKKKFLPDGTMRFLFIGRMVAKKRPDLVLERVKEVQRSGMACELCMIGDGPLRAELAAANANAGFPIHWQGVVKRNEIARFMKWADCLLMTSGYSKTGDTEGLPNILLEAMASGLPVIATDVGSTTEVLNRNTGTIWDPMEPTSLMPIIKQMLKDPEAINKNIDRARAMVEADFDARKLMARRVHLLRELKGL